MTEDQARKAKGQDREFPETMEILARVREALAARLFLTAIGEAAIREDLYTRVQALDALQTEMAAILATNASEKAMAEYAESIAPTGK